MSNLLPRSEQWVITRTRHERIEFWRGPLWMSETTMWGDDPITAATFTSFVDCSTAWYTRFPDAAQPTMSMLAVAEKRWSILRRLGAEELSPHSYGAEVSRRYGVDADDYAWADDGYRGTATRTSTWNRYGGHGTATTQFRKERVQEIFAEIFEDVTIQPKTHTAPS